MRPIATYSKTALFILTLCCGLCGCTTAISRTELQQKLGTQPPPLLVDVRSAAEYREDHIPGAVHVPFYSAGSGISALAPDSGRMLVIYCEHGPRAAWAGISLYLHGYGEVYSLEGHMSGWRAGGLPVEKAPR